MSHRNLPIPALAVVLGVLATHAAAQRDPRADDPTPPPPTFAQRSPLFGDDRTVDLLAELLDDDDPRVRTRAASALGESHNPDAAPHIRRAMDDPSALVRVAALRAAVELPLPDRRELLARAAQSDRTALLYEAMRLSREHPDLQVVDVALARDDADTPRLLPTLLASANRLGVRIRPETLAHWLTSGNPAIRRAAAENAALSSDASDELGPEVRSSAPPLLEALREAVDGTGEPLLAASALVALARRAPDEARRRLADNLAHDHPARRRGALRAMAVLGVREGLADRLDDESALVRLAAVRAAGALRCRACIDGLMTHLLARPTDAHRAAEASLRAIGGQDVHQPVVDALRRLCYRPGEMPHALRLRTLRALCGILADANTPAGLDLRLDLLADVPAGNLPGISLSSSLPEAVAASIEHLDDPRITPALRALLAIYNDKAPSYLRAEASPMATPVPYSESSAAACMLALARRGDVESLPAIARPATLIYEDLRLGEQNVAAARAAEMLDTPATRQQVETLLLEILTGRSYGSEAIFHASISAGRLGLESAAPALRRIAYEVRPRRDVIAAAGWALERIAGPLDRPLPDPVPRVSDLWIIRKARE
jgi:HEAT repeat protein